MGTKPRFKGQPPVDSYGDGGFRLADQRFEGSIVVTPLGLYPWMPKSVEEITPASLAPVIEAAGHFDFLIIGSGESTLRLSADAKRRLESHAIFPDVMATGPACRTYNMMLSENRRVAAAFIAVALVGFCRAWLFSRKLLAFPQMATLSRTMMRHAIPGSGSASCRLCWPRLRRVAIRGESPWQQY